MISIIRQLADIYEIGGDFSLQYFIVPTHRDRLYGEFRVADKVL